MLWLRGIKISTSPDIPSELYTRHELTDKDVLLLHNIHVKKISKGLGIKNCYNVRIDPSKERKCWRHICTEHGGLVLVSAFLEEGIRTLEPEVV